MRLLITGGCGYVGRELVRQAVAGGHEVHVIDNLNCGTYRLRNMDLSTFNLHLANICDNEMVERIIEQVEPECAIHLAAIHFIPACEKNPSYATSVNVLGTVNLLNTLPAACRFLYTSTAAVYAPCDESMSEMATIGPMDVYGWTKWHGEEYTRHLRKSAWIVRLFNVIGRGETNPHVLPAIVSQLKQGSDILRLGNLSARRDYIDVEDVASGFLRLANIEPDSVIPVNLGTSRDHSVEELLNELRKVSGQNFNVETDPARLRPVDRPLLRANVEKLKAITNWTPQRQLVDTLTDLWQDPQLAPDLAEGC